MSRLTRVELRRLFSRRLVQVLILLVLGVVGLALYGVNDMTRMSLADQSNADRYYHEAVEDWERNGEMYVEDCLREQEREREATGDESVDFGCEQLRAPILEDFRWVPPSLSAQFEELLGQLIGPVLFLVLVIGATSTAAEFAARTMGTWLTFEPRRDRVYGSKVLAAGLGAVPVAVGYLALVVLGVSAIFRLHGVDDAITTAEWTALGWTGVRSVALLALVAAVGAATGLLLRHTAAVLGAALGYVIVVEMMLRSLRPGLERYLLSNNVLAWVGDGHEWTTWVCPPTGGDCTDTLHRLSLGHGAVVIAVVAAALLLLSFLVFRRRDVD